LITPFLWVHNSEMVLSIAESFMIGSKGFFFFFFFLMLILHACSYFICNANRKGGGIKFVMFDNYN
jgi:hypothetical protein